MKIGEAERWLQQQLHGAYDVGEINTIAVWVFEKVTGLSRINWLTKKEEPLPVDQLHELKSIAQRLQAHEPVQYVLGEAYFHGLTLYVDNNVLIPRPETEELVAWVIKDVKAAGKDVFNTNVGEADQTRNMRILDVGTGSGCIALALKNAMPKAEVWGCDSSDAALNVARRNGALLNIRVDFQQVNILEPAQWNNLPHFDLIISNPPYITRSEKEEMPSNVVQYEPHLALFVPDENPFIFYEVLARFGKEKLNKNGVLYVEIHEERAKEVVELFQNLISSNVELRQDMQGKDRMVKVTLT